MIKTSVLILIILNSNCQIWAQESASTEYIVIIAELIGTESTGKRHNSHYFTFKTKEVLSGKTNDSIFVSQEIYHDFGAKQIHPEIYPKQNFYQDKNHKAKDVIIKYLYKKSGVHGKVFCQIIWVVEMHRRKSLENLKTTLESYFSKKGQNELDRYLFPKELNGKLFLI